MADSPPVSVLDVPYLSPQIIPEGLKAAVSKAKTIVFADPCKFGQNPLSARAVQLHEAGLLEGKRWVMTAAPQTYNPLSRTLTFLNETDIQMAIQKANMK